MSGALAPLVCPRCGRTPEATAPRHHGCPSCRAEGIAVNLQCSVPLERVRDAVHSARTDGRRGLARWGPALPVVPDATGSLGEGDTPLVGLPRLARRLGVGTLLAKNESQNPTWSHKDRLCALTVAAARAAGARVVCAASTGNHGASLAAYAARAGLRCLIATMASVPETMKTLMQSYGASVVAVERSEERYELLEQGIARYGWWPASNMTTPPVGSDPYGVDGYKTIAYELAEQRSEAAPDWLCLPVAYGDCLAGVARGYTELEQLGIARAPRLIGAEVFGALGQALGGGAPGPVPTRDTAAFSIGGAWATMQAVRALENAEGIAAAASEQELLDMQRELALSEGFFAEAASCVPLAVVARLASEGRIGGEDTVAVVLTSSGLKDPSRAASTLPSVPVIEPTLDSLADALARTPGGADALADFCTPEKEPQQA